tara:strand:+ start:296 stop:547 length:252 start_codon:yes stop_codon:yes gene_type:complete
MLKKDKSIKKDIIIICEFSLNILEISLTGRKPPDEINVKAKLRELKYLIEKIFNIIKIKRVRKEYKRNIFKPCLNISELLKEI